MTTQRKVRKDFDRNKHYFVNVSKCTEEEKKVVQQAFFDAGFEWHYYGRQFVFLSADIYTNAPESGTNHILWRNGTFGCNMTAEEFLNIVYELEQN